MNNSIQNVDNLINLINNNKNIIISVVTGIFIYNRKLDYYKTMPRLDPKISILIMIWTYLSIIEPWFILVGLIIINIFGFKHTSI